MKVFEQANFIGLRLNYNKVNFKYILSIFFVAVCDVLLDGCASIFIFIPSIRVDIKMISRRMKSGKNISPAALKTDHNSARSRIIYSRNG